MEPPVGLRARWPLVGRDALLARLRRVVPGGPVRAVVLHGPAGVGKTRVMDDLVAGLGDGVRVVRVTATPASAEIPLGVLAEFVARGEPDPELLSRDSVHLIAQAHRVAGAVADGGSLLVAVDDLPQLDRLSAVVLGALVDAGTARLVATARTGEALPDAVIGWWTSGRAERVDVDPLHLDDVGLLLERVLGAPVAVGAVAAAHEATAGLPLHLREVVADAVERGELVETAGVWRLAAEGRRLGVPTALHDLLLRRVAGLPDADRDVLNRLVVCSALRLTEFRTDVTEPVLRLEAAGLVEVAGDDPDPLLRPAHPQLAAVLAQLLPPLRTRTMLAEHTALVEGRADPEDAVRVAQWRLATGTVAPEVLVRGARLAAAGHDHRAAERLAAAAARTPDAPPEAWLLLARTRWETGRPQEVLDTFDEAGHGLDRRAADAAVLRAAALADDPRREAEARHALRPVLELLRARERADLRTTVAGVLLELDRVDDAAAVVDLPGGRAGEVSTPALHEAPAVTARVLVAAGRSAEALRHVPAVGNRPDAPTLVARAAVLMDRLDVPAAAAAARAAVGVAVETGRMRALVDAELVLARASRLAGDLAGAGRWCRDVVSGGFARGHPRHRLRGLVAQAAVAALRGDVVLLRATLDELGDAAPAVARALGRAHLDGDRRGAAELLAAAARGDEERGALVRAGERWFEAAALAPAPPAAREATDRLRRLAARCDSPTLLLQAEHAAARVAGDAARLAAVVDRWERAGALVNAQRAALDAAGAAGAGRQAAGATARAAALAMRLPEVALPGVAQPARDALTAREREVAELAAAGASSADIAARLVLSVRTVDNHLGNAYTKLGITRRGQLRAALRGR